MAHEVGQINSPNTLGQLQLPARLLKVFFTDWMEIPETSNRLNQKDDQNTTTNHHCECVSQELWRAFTWEPSWSKLTRSPSDTAAEWWAHSASHPLRKHQHSIKNLTATNGYVYGSWCWILFSLTWHSAGFPSHRPTTWPVVFTTLKMGLVRSPILAPTH